MKWHFGLAVPNYFHLHPGGQSVLETLHPPECRVWCLLLPLAMLVELCEGACDESEQHHGHFHLFIPAQVLEHTKGSPSLRWHHATRIKHSSGSSVPLSTTRTPGTWGPGLCTTCVGCKERTLGCSWGFTAQHLPTAVGKAVQSERSCAAAGMLLSLSVMGCLCLPVLQSCLSVDVPLKNSVFPTFPSQQRTWVSTWYAALAQHSLA